MPPPAFIHQNWAQNRMRTSACDYCNEKNISLQQCHVCYINICKPCMSSGWLEDDPKHMLSGEAADQFEWHQTRKEAMQEANTRPVPALVPIQGRRHGRKHQSRIAPPVPQPPAPQPPAPQPPASQSPAPQPLAPPRTQAQRQPQAQSPAPSSIDYSRSSTGGIIGQYYHEPSHSLMPYPDDERNMPHQPSHRMQPSYSQHYSQNQGYHFSPPPRGYYGGYGPDDHAGAPGYYNVAPLDEPQYSPHPGPPRQLSPYPEQERYFQQQSQTPQHNPRYSPYPGPPQQQAQYPQQRARHHKQVPDMAMQMAQWPREPAQYHKQVPDMATQMAQWPREPAQHPKQASDLMQLLQTQRSPSYSPEPACRQHTPQAQNEYEPRIQQGMDRQYQPRQASEDMFVEQDPEQDRQYQPRQASEDMFVEQDPEQDPAPAPEFIAASPDDMVWEPSSQGANMATAAAVVHNTKPLPPTMTSGEATHWLYSPKRKQRTSIQPKGPQVQKLAAAPATVWARAVPANNNQHKTAVDLEFAEAMDVASHFDHDNCAPQPVEGRRVAAHRGLEEVQLASERDALPRHPSAKNKNKPAASAKAQRSLAAPIQPKVPKPAAAAGSNIVFRTSRSQEGLRLAAGNDDDDLSRHPDPSNKNKPAASAKAQASITVPGSHKTLQPPAAEPSSGLKRPPTTTPLSPVLNETVHRSTQVPAPDEAPASASGEGSSRTAEPTAATATKKKKKRRTGRNKNAADKQEDQDPQPELRAAIPTLLRAPESQSRGGKTMGRGKDVADKDEDQELRRAVPKVATQPETATRRPTPTASEVEAAIAQVRNDPRCAHMDESEIQAIVTLTMMQFNLIH